MTSFNVIVGTYEEFLLGFTCKPPDTDDQPEKLLKIFASHSHTASIRCVSGWGEIIASGGADDKIFVYSLRSKQEIAILTVQSSTVNTLEFAPDGSHLFAGCADGSMLAYSCETWEVVRTWKDAHKGSSVNQIRIHPSGKLALSLGGDLTLRSWNLVKGRQAFAKNLKSMQELGRIVECVEWCPDGKQFALSGSQIVQIWSLADASVCATIKCASRPTCLAWITEDLLAVGQESGKILLHRLSGGAEEKSVEAHEKRVKDISCRNPHFLTSVGSAGDVKVWSVDQTKLGLRKISSTNIGCRPTCVVNTANDEFPAVKQEKSSEGRGEVVVEEELPEEMQEEVLETPKKVKEKKKKRKSEVFLPPAASSAKKAKKRQSFNPFASFTVTDIDPEDLNQSLETVKVKKRKTNGMKNTLNRTIN
ncbi:p21-activated protein kinase-interacting protein 1-like [Phlebotomus argentipes]|uniref:p21-activated protein kinase-interacting protein 1-like n=1 Tax=Phlebotomus argentipes TaxID=94469 RepID=UPI0028931F10|nr:p21-activated protein kinase-interacting protein 1-like [Phlebotomus argentipes]